MAGGVSPVVRGRRLAAALRELRVAAGKTIEDVAVQLECSAAKVSRIENGHVGVRIQDAREMLEFYRVAEAEREALLELVRQARGRGWWYPYADVMPEGFVRFVGLEDEATAIWVLDAAGVPGLLQTERYAKELLNTLRDVPAEVVRRRVELRMARQQVLSRPEPPQLHVVIGETALRRRVGDDELMREQVRHLIEAAEAPNITLQVLLFDAPTNPGLALTFVIFGFLDPIDPKAVYEELIAGSVYHESAAITSQYGAAFDHAGAAALNPKDSLAFLRTFADEPA